MKTPARDGKPKLRTKSIKASSGNWGRMNELKRRTPLTAGLPSHDDILTMLLDNFGRKTPDQEKLEAIRGQVLRSFLEFLSNTDRLTKEFVLDKLSLDKETADELVRRETEDVDSKRRRRA